MDGNYTDRNMAFKIDDVTFGNYTELGDQNEVQLHYNVYNNELTPEVRLTSNLEFIDLFKCGQKFAMHKQTEPGTSENSQSDINEKYLFRLETFYNSLSAL